MGRQVFSDGILVERWDDETQTYSGPDGQRPFTESEALEQSAAARQARRAELRREVAEALTLSQSAIERSNAIRDDALVIANSEASTLTDAQVVVVLKRLARAVAVLAQHDARNRRDIDALIRLATSTHGRP